MSTLLARIPDDLEPLCKKFKEHVKKAGLTTVAKLVSGGGSAAATSCSPEPKAYIDTLLKVCCKKPEMLTGASMVRLDLS